MILKNGSEWKHSTPIEYGCPRCGEPVKVGDNDSLVYCPQCKAALIVDSDADFINGVWYDCTRLVEQILKSTDFTE